MAAPLSADQAAVYDRQLRVWGVEVQHRLASSRVLIVGGNGLAAEVAKNIVLAGVGHVGIADSTPCAHAPFGNFLIPADASPNATVAEVCARTLQGMNPFVRVSPETRCSSSSSTLHIPDEVLQSGGGGSTTSTLHIPDEVLQSYDTILSTQHGIVTTEAKQLEGACCASGKHLFLTQTLGLCSTTYINLGGKHAYAEKGQQPQQNGSASSQGPALKEMLYPRLEQALSKPVKECLGRRPVHAMYQVLRVLQVYVSQEQPQQQKQSQQVMVELEAIAASMEDREVAPRNSINRAYLQECAEAMSQQGPDSVFACMQGPSAAVVGGVVANAIVRAISKVGAPLRNFFFFSPADGQGMVEDIAGPAGKS